jgi:hypothetical protein
VETKPRRFAALRRVSRDTVLFVSGLVGIGWQTFTGKVHVELLAVFAVMIGLPGYVALQELLPARRGREDPAATTLPSSPPQPSPSPPSSPTS